MSRSSGDNGGATRRNTAPLPSAVRNVFSLPRKWLGTYQAFITKNASQVSQIESALRSLTYIIPGRFRDAEIASESIHSGVQLLSLYHDSILSGTLPWSKTPFSCASAPTPHNRYTCFWVQKSTLYRRVAYVLQMVCHTELLCEMAARRRGEKMRWRVVVLLEAVKAMCRLLLLRMTRWRPLVTPALPEREPMSENAADEEDTAFLAADGDTSHDSSQPRVDGFTAPLCHSKQGAPATREWSMPRTGMSLPSLPPAGDISNYLLSRVLTADDIKPATKLLQIVRGTRRAAEVLHILAPLLYAVALARCENCRKSWKPWLIGLALEVAARQLRAPRRRRHGGAGPPTLEQEEWTRRGWAMGWWAIRGAFYENVTKGCVGGLKRRMPALVAGIIEDYEYLWEQYYFSTSA